MQKYISSGRYANMIQDTIIHLSFDAPNLIFVFSKKIARKLMYWIIVFPMNQSEKFTNDNKWAVSLLAGLMFVIIGSPYLYALTQGGASLINSNIKLIGLTGRPTYLGLLLHGLVFALITRLLMA